MSQDHFRALLSDLRQARGESLAEFGRTLARVVDPPRAFPYSRSYVSKLESGAAPITAEIARALEVLAAMLDGVGEVQATARPVTVQLLALHDLPDGTVIKARPVQCALPGCRVIFIPAGRERYCSAECRREARRRHLAARRRGRNPRPRS